MGGISILLEQLLSNCPCDFVLIIILIVAFLTHIMTVSVKINNKIIIDNDRLAGDVSEWKQWSVALTKKWD